MAKISLKRKAGGTKVGNFLRKVSKVVGVGGLSANAIGSQKPKGMEFRVGTPGMTPQQIAKANQTLGISKTTTGGLTYDTKDAGAVQNFQSKGTSQPIVNIDQAIKSGGLKTSGGNTKVNANTFNSPTTALSAGQFEGDIAPLSGFSSRSFSGTGTNNVSSGSSSIPTSNIINTQNLGDNTLFNYPDLTTPDYNSYIPTPIDQQIEEQDKKGEDDLNSVLKQLTKDFNNQDSASEIDAKLRKELDIENKQKLVSDLSGQLNAIVAKGQANQLSLIGQGRGIPEAIIGGQQAQIARETAIAALPVQAQLEAAQGNLEMANESLDRLFKIYSEESQREFAFKKEVLMFAYENADKTRQEKLKRLYAKQERAEEELKDLREEQQTYAKMAFSNGQSSLGAKIAKLDYKSPTFRNDLANLQAKLNDPMRDLDRRIKEAQLATETAKTKSGGLSETGLSVIEVARDLLNNPELNRITGTIDQLGGGLVSDQAKLARNKWKQLKGILSLENRQLLKGSGAISDFEFRVLGEAATALGRNLSDETFRSELTKLITKLSPEYQYIDNISGAIDSDSGNGVDISNYLNRVIGINF